LTVLFLSEVIHRKQYPKRRVPVSRIALHNTAVVANDLRNNGKAQTLAFHFGRYKGVEKIGSQTLWNSWAIILYGDLQRQRNPLTASR
jgi:hypothetical protein